MRWWKKVTLFFLSGVLLIACTEIKEDEALISPQFFFSQVLKEWTSNEPQHDSLALYVTNLEHAMEGTIQFSHNSEELSFQTFEFSAESDSTLLPFLNELNLSLGDGVTHNSYTVWRTSRNGRSTLEISFSPHPVKKWLLSFRERGQE